MIHIPAMITVGWLRRRRACPEQIERFKAEWPDGAEPTHENLLRAAELRLNVDWLALTLLRGDALWAYERVRAMAYDIYSPVKRTFESSSSEREAAHKVYCKSLAIALCEQISEGTA